MLDTKKLLDWLEANERTQSWLARKAGITPPHLNAWLNGKRNGSQRALDALEDATGMKRGALRAQSEEAAQINS